MAGTMAFYNGMMPGITKMVESFAGDAASQRGYRQAATAEAAIANARRDNIEGQLKVREYEDTDKNAMGYAIGQHGVSAPELQEFMRHRSGKLNPGEAAREYSPQDMERFNPAVRDYSAFKTGKFHDVSQGATGFAQLPAVQNSVRAAADYGKTPGVSAADIIRMSQASMGKNVLSAEESVPTSVREAQWLQTASPELRASWMTGKKAGQSPGTTINMPNATQYGVDPATKRPGMFQIGRNGETIFTPIDPAPPQGSGGPQSSVGKLMHDVKKGFVNGAPAPSAGGQQRKQVGTSGGRPVYEVNGKRYIEE